MINNTIMQKSFKSFVISLTLFLGTMLLLSETSWAGDINAVFTDINTKTESLTAFVISTIVYVFCVISALATLLGIMMKKLAWDDAVKILIIIICIGFTPTIVAWLLNK